MRSKILCGGLAAVVFVLIISVMLRGAAPAKGEWAAYKGDKKATQYSPLDQINRDNVKNLQVVWRQSALPMEMRQGATNVPLTNNYEHTPLMVGGLLYMSSGIGSVAALNPGTGRVVWFDTARDSAERSGPNRGLAYWSDGNDNRVVATAGKYLIELNAQTGKRVDTFGDHGRVDLTNGFRRPITSFRFNSPAIVVRDVIVVGGQPAGATDYTNDEQAAVKTMPPEDVRGFDVRSGKLLWTFHVVPDFGEPGYETWLNESAAYSGAAGIWGVMSADEDLGYVYLPDESGTSDYYGGARPGANLFANCLVALDVKTGKKVWYFQAVHHDLWDYDFTAPPILLDITVNGKRIKAIAAPTKQNFLYVLDRVTGQPVWPIVERPVPKGDTPGEWYSPTQPFPTKPPAYDQQGMTVDDLIDFTPELRQRAMKILSQYRYGPIFTAPSVGNEGLDGKTKGTVEMPGTAGGGNWQGGGADPETGIVYAPSVKIPVIVELVKSKNPKSDLAWVRHTAALTGNFEMVDDSGALIGLPIVKPPYGSLVAIDLNKGDILWRVPNGSGPRDHPALKGLNLPPLGQPGRAAPLVTKTLVFLGEGGRHGARIPVWGGGKMFRAFDKQTGKVVSEMALPGGTTGAPMTYLYNGKQYIVAAVTWDDNPAELVALALP